MTATDADLGEYHHHWLFMNCDVSPTNGWESMFKIIVNYRMTCSHTADKSDANNQYEIYDDFKGIKSIWHQIKPESTGHKGRDLVLSTRKEGKWLNHRSNKHEEAYVHGARYHTLSHNTYKVP